MQIIEVIVSPQGESTIQTRGFQLQTCRAASQFLEEALGQRRAEQLTAEFYQPQLAAQPLQQGQR
ncbi:DUF2997 domain-containing protein [Anatilimnocola sp. NA78]|uniref:DUF2997 domain-containing protein n=1 Tax=Anatilimnocola sp. NA78 TaxID=3415683 RepID=UPI003CE4977A